MSHKASLLTSMVIKIGPNVQMNYPKAHLVAKVYTYVFDLDYGDAVHLVARWLMFAFFFLYLVVISHAHFVG